MASDSADDQIQPEEIPKISSKDIKLDETPIGRGGYGYVYRGTHKDMGTIAIKTMIADGLLPMRHQKIFKSEGKKLWELKHSSIVRLLGLIMEENNYSLILEYMHFGSLTAFRSDFPNIGWSLIVGIVRDVILGMDYLHSGSPPILHLDMKSDNILINRRIRAKITDFGLAQWKTMTRTMTRTQTGERVGGRKGTVTHVPPEVWNNINIPPMKAYDIYSFGIVLWETIAHDRPFSLVNDDVIPKAVLSGQRPDLTIIPSDCPQALTSMMTRCWSQQPDKRPEFSVIKPEIESLFESLAPDVPKALTDLEQEIQKLYEPDDIGGDTTETAQSETLFDAAAKITKKLTAAIPPDVEMTDVKETAVSRSSEGDMHEMQSAEPTPSTSRTVNQSISDTAVPATVSVTSSSDSNTAPKTATSTAPATTTSTAPATTMSTAPATTMSTTPAATTSTAPATTTSTAPATTTSSTTTTSTNSSAETSSEMDVDTRKALRRVLRDPVGLFLLHRDASLCKSVFGVENSLQTKIKTPLDLQLLLEADPQLRIELARKGQEYIGWIFHPYRMKDEIRKKRPKRVPKPEAVERMRKLKEERERRERREMEGKKEDKKGGGGFFGLFKKDKRKEESSYSIHDAYYMFDPMNDMMGMNVGDIGYKLRRVLKDPLMMRYILDDNRSSKIMPIDREVMDVVRDPDRLLYMLDKDPELMDTLMRNNKDAVMKIIGRARGGPNQGRYGRHPRSMRMMYPHSLERDMMDMDLRDEMMMMKEMERQERSRAMRRMPEMMSRPMPSMPSITSMPSMPSRPSMPSSSSTATTAAKPSGTSSAATSSTSSSSTNDAKTTATRSAATTVTSSASDAKTSPTSTTSEKSSSTSKPPSMEVKKLPDDHLLKRQKKEKEEKIPVQRNTDTQPLETVLPPGVFSRKADETAASQSEKAALQSEKAQAPSCGCTSEPSVSSHTKPTTSNQSGKHGQSSSEKTSIRVKMNADGSVDSMNADLDDMPPNIQLGSNNLMMISGGPGKRSQKYNLKHKLFSKKPKKMPRSNDSDDEDEMTPHHMEVVAQMARARWHMIAKELGFQASEIQDLEKQYGQGSRPDLTCGFIMLMKWKERVPGQTTVPRLVQVLKDAQCLDIVQALMELH